MTQKEFTKYIKSIGFKHNKHYNSYEYKEYYIDLYNNYYTFYNGSKWSEHNYNELTLLLKVSRSYKLKQLLR